MPPLIWYFFGSVFEHEAMCCVFWVVYRKDLEGVRKWSINFFLVGSMTWRYFEGSFFRLFNLLECNKVLVSTFRLNQIIGMGLMFCHRTRVWFWSIVSLWLTFNCRTMLKIHGIRLLYRAYLVKDAYQLLH